jgi:ubiquinone/menaquinone biosynthesis C-methylase UbiE
MQRIPEPELMIDDKQARAYALADFEQPHSMFIQLFLKHFPNDTIIGNVLDLGCGTADITRRFAQAFVQCHLDGVDNSEPMLKYGRDLLKKYRLTDRIRLLKGYLPGAKLPVERYNAVISNSLLHHLAEPMVLWNTIKAVATPEAPIFIMDLMRPESPTQAKIITNQYTQGEPEILRQDFYNSLLAAYRIDEVQKQLQDVGLDHLHVLEVSDRHLVVMGKLKKRPMSGHFINR